LDQINVDQSGEGRVAADPDDSDAALGARQLLDDLEQQADCDGLAATRAEVVLAIEEQCGLQRPDLVRGLAGGSIGVENEE
jgi:hypothetical protein